MWNLKEKKKSTNKLIYRKKKIDPQTQKTSSPLWLPKGKRRKINQEFGLNIYILPYLKQIINKDLTI